MSHSKQASTTEDKAYLAGGAGSVGLAGKMHYDVARADRRMREWENAAQQLSDKIKPTTLASMPEAEALQQTQRAMDVYTRLGLRVGTAPLLGTRAGVLPKARVWFDYYRQMHGLKSLPTPPQASELAALATARDARLHHYDLFASNAPAKSLRGHMVEKGMEALSAGETDKLPEQIRRILFTGDADVQQRLGQMKALPSAAWGVGNTAETAAQKAEDTAKWLKQSFIGLPLDEGPRQLGEVGRLLGAATGKGKAAVSVGMSTPSVYREASAPMMRALLKGRNILGGAGAGLLAVLGAKTALAPSGNGAAVKSAADNAPQDSSQTLRNIGAAGLFGAAPLSALSGIGDLRGKGIDTIGVTYGRQHYPGAMIGGGHKEPADALRELIYAENKRRGGGYKMMDYVRNEHGVLGVLDHTRDANGKVISSQWRQMKPSERAANVMVNTGFGDYTPQSSAKDRVFTSEGVLQNTPLQGRVKSKSLFNYLTDAVPDDVPAFGATALDGNPSGRTFMAGWGDTYSKRRGTASRIRKLNDPWDVLTRMGLGRLRHAAGSGGSYTRPLDFGASVPFALSADKLDMLARLRAPGGSEAELQKMLRDPGSSDEAKAAVKSILGHVSSGGKLITISGASRGDYVASRAAELSQRLKELGRTDVKILAQVAGAAAGPHGPGRAAEMKLIEGLDNVIPVGRMSQPSFIAAQNLANLHLNSTGTSSWAEALLGRPNAAQPKEWGFHMQWPDHTPHFVDDSPSAMRAIEQKTPTIAKRLQMALQNISPDIDPHYGQAGIGGWNRGQLQHQVRNGRMLADSADDIIRLLDSGAKNPDNAAKLDQEIRAAQKLFTNSIFREAGRNKWMTGLKGAGKLAAPLAMIPMGLSLLRGNSNGVGPAAPRPSVPMDLRLPSLHLPNMRLPRGN